METNYSNILLSRVLSAFMLLVMVLALFGCAGNQGIAPVDDRGTHVEQRSSVSERAKSQRLFTNQHRVVKGDTLYSIAFANRLYFPDVARWNVISKPYVIKIDQVLNLYPPNGEVGAVVEESKTIAPPKSSTTRAKPKGKAQIQAKSASTKKHARYNKKPAKTKAVARVRWTWPTRGKLTRKFSRRGLGKKGIAIVGKPGQAIRSAAAGRIVYAGSGLVGYGKLIIVKHNKTFLSAYAHNRRLLVKEGDRVQIGQPIGEMGSTGTDRTMLHFEIRRRGKPVNPLAYLP